MAADPFDAPFLDPTPPAWAARALAWVLLSLAAVAALALVFVTVPETVTAPFVIVADTGADPVRALHAGVVTAVMAGDAEHVEAGATLFMIAAETVGDRSAERESLGTSLSGGEARLANERTRFDSQRQADAQELSRLGDRLVALKRQLALKEQQWSVAKDVHARSVRSEAAGATSWMEVSKVALEADRLAVDVEQVKAEIAETTSHDARVRFEMTSRRAAFDELARSVNEELSRTRGRKAMLDREREQSGNILSVTAACRGTVVRLLVRRPGTVVAESDPLAEIACDGEALQAELMVADRAMALVREEQAVKLQYDAFPYQRYGVKFATVKWISPTSSPPSPAGERAFRLLAGLDDQVLQVNGAPRPVRPGMSGQAAIVVGRRSLGSYAVEPLRQLRESLAAERTARDGRR